MTEYKTMGCASFLDGAELAEELQPIGCARFESEKIVVESCFQVVYLSSLFERERVFS